MSVCDDNCRDCVFHAWMGFRLICNFLGVMGRRRGCPAGAGCAEKIVGEAASLSAGMPGIGPKAQYPEDSGETSSPNRSRGFDLGTGDVPSSAPAGDSSLPEETGKETKAKKRKKKLTAEEIAERKRKKAEYHREWAKKNRQHVLEYQRQRRKKKRETEERIATSAAPPRNDEEGKDRG